MSASRLAPNWAFVLATATTLAARGRILDYGCGHGEVVAAGVERGLDICGAEMFYAGGHGQREATAWSGLLGERVFEVTIRKLAGMVVLSQREDGEGPSARATTLA